MSAGAITSMPAEQAVVRLRGVSKSWTGVRLLNGIDLDVRLGALTVLVGPSGSGRTTVLTMLAEWTSPDAGRLEWRDGFTPDRRARWRHVALLPQSIALLPELSLLENVALPLRLDGAGASDSMARARATLDVLDLGSLAGRPANDVSLGQHQRAALARAAVMPPDLLLADEPTSHQDPLTAGLVIGVVRQLAETRLGARHRIARPAVQAAGDIIMFGRRPPQNAGSLAEPSNGGTSALDRR